MSTSSSCLVLPGVERFTAWFWYRLEWDFQLVRRPAEILSCGRSEIEARRVRGEPRGRGGSIIHRFILPGRVGLEHLVGRHSGPFSQEVQAIQGVRSGQQRSRSQRGGGSRPAPRGTEPSPEGCGTCPIIQRPDFAPGTLRGNVFLYRSISTILHHVPSRKLRMQIARFRVRWTRSPCPLRRGTGDDFGEENAVACTARGFMVSVSILKLSNGVYEMSRGRFVRMGADEKFLGDPLIDF